MGDEPTGWRVQLDEAVAAQYPDLARILDAAPDDRQRLIALTAIVGEGKAFTRHVVRLRDYTARRLVDRGFSNREVARLAGLSDSVLSRRRRSQPRRPGDDVSDR